MQIFYLWVDNHVCRCLIAMCKGSRCGFDFLCRYVKYGCFYCLIFNDFLKKKMIGVFSHTYIKIWANSYQKITHFCQILKWVKLNGCWNFVIFLYKKNVNHYPINKIVFKVTTLFFFNTHNVNIVLYL
jgi:hypothetical protein